MTEVQLHVYDLTNSTYVKVNNARVQLNILLRDGMGVGGFFHGAIQVYDEEWYFGFCEDGSGVCRCPPKENPTYTYRESVHLGTTSLSMSAINRILGEMSSDWEGCTYDVLSRNCNHFCEALCARLGVEELPLWLNQLAKTCDPIVSLTAEVTRNTIERVKQAKEEVVTAGMLAYRFMFCGPTLSTYRLMFCCPMSSTVSPYGFLFCRSTSTVSPAPNPRGMIGED